MGQFKQCLVSATPAGAHYGPAKYSWIKKSGNMPVWVSKTVLPCIFAHDAEAGKRHYKAL
jgi:hypothetical protein